MTRPQISLRRALEIAAIAAVAAVAGIGLPRLFPHLGAVENHVADIRVAGLAAPEPQHPDVLILAITEDTLAALPYRAPLDRGFLARLLRGLDAAGVRTIGLDILFDQPTEAAKDADLFQAMRSLRAPLVVAWANKDDQLTEKQTAYIDTFLAGIKKGLPNLNAGSIDGIVRTIHRGRTIEGVRVAGLATAIAAAAGVEPPEDSTALAYRPSPDPKTPPFRTFPAHTAAFLPKPWLAGKIVLVGADMPHTDRFPAPFGSGGTIAGVAVHAHALAQILEGRKPPGTGLAGAVALLVVVAFAGLAIAGADVSVPLKFAGVAVGLVLL